MQIRKGRQQGKHDVIVRLFMEAGLKLALPSAPDIHENTKKQAVGTKDILKPTAPRRTV
jgi:hypothetical protein